MGKVNSMLLDLGPGAEQINLSTLPETQNDDRTTLTRTSQTFTGSKAFMDIASSPDSKRDIFSADDEDLVTYGQLAAYRDRIENQIVESGLQFGSGDSIQVDDAADTVTFNPPIVEMPTTGRIVYRGVTSKGWSYVHALFKELLLKYAHQSVALLEPTLVRIYTTSEAEPPAPPDPESGGSGGGGNSHVPKECPLVTATLPAQGVVSVPGKVIWHHREGGNIVICYRPNEC